MKVGHYVILGAALILGAAILIATGNMPGCETQKEPTLTKSQVDAIIQEVVVRSVPAVNEIALKNLKDTVDIAASAASAKVINQALPSVVDAATIEVVEKAVGPVVKQAVPKVVAQAKKECCPERTASAPSAAPLPVPVMQSEHYRVSPAAQVVSSPPPPVPIPVSAPPPVAVDTTRIPNPDLPPRIVDGERLLTPRCGGGMGPQLLPAGVSVSFDGTRVRIAGIQPVKVELYNSSPPRILPGASDFSAGRGVRFNFTYRCGKGHEHYVLLTQNMAAFLPDFFGPGIGLDNSDCCGSSFITE